MKTTIDSGGRVVIPKKIRERLGLGPGNEVELVEHDGWIEVLPVPTPMRLTEEGTVAVADREMPVLTAEVVRETLENVRR